MVLAIVENEAAYMNQHIHTEMTQDQPKGEKNSFLDCVPNLDDKSTSQEPWKIMLGSTKCNYF